MKKTQIRTMSGVARLSVDLCVQAAKAARDASIPVLALFPNTSDDLRN